MTTAPAGLDPVVDRASSVDAALRSWRSETVERRAVWDAEQEVVQAEMRRRRQRAGMAFAAGLGTAIVVGTLGVLAFTPSPVNPTSASAGPIAPPVIEAIPQVGAEGSIAPVVEVVSAAPTAEIGLLGEVASWEKSGSLWVQFDYTGAPLVLEWLDAAGVVALEPTPCVNTVGAGVRRCYVGRTATRVQMALDAGATPGTWTVQACRSGLCSTVASYAVGAI